MAVSRNEAARWLHKVLRRSEVRELVQRYRGAGCDGKIERDAHTLRGTFEGKSAGNRIPEVEAQSRRAAGPQRHVRGVGEKIHHA